MEKGQFEDLVLTDPKTFARYARLFMDLEGIAQQGFLDWCWEKWLEGTQPSPIPPVLASTFILKEWALPFLRESENKKI